LPFAKSILIPTDFSSKSENAIKYACEIASNTGGEIHFLNVLEEPYDFPSRVEEVLSEQVKQNEEKLSSIIEGLHSNDEYRIIKMKGMVKTGKVLSTTQSIARKHHHDLIVIGLGGKANLKKALYGSITNHLLMTSDLPVLAVSKRVEYAKPHTMIFTTDMRKNDIHYIKMMREFCIDIGVKLRFAHIVEPGKEASQKKLNKFNKKIQKITNDPGASLQIYEAPSLTEGITSAAGDDKHTLVVMIRYRKKFLEWLLSNSSVRSVAQLANVPLLMIPADG